MTEKWYDYTCDYQYQGHTWVFKIKARTHEEAQARIRAIGISGNVKGKIIMEGRLTPHWWQRWF